MMVNTRPKNVKNGSSTSDQKEEIATDKSKTNSMFSKPWKGSDAVLIVEEKELHVHTSVLSIASEYFDKMFNGNFIEAKTKRVTLEGKSYELIEHVLRLMYPIQARLGMLTFRFYLQVFYSKGVFIEWR